MIETDTRILKGGDQYRDRLPQAVIYSLINLANGKRYIGRTRNPRQRISNHLAALKGHYHKNPLINKDSDCMFGFEILEENVSFLERSNREVHYILEYRTFDERYGYNCNDPALKVLKIGRFSENQKVSKDYRSEDAESISHN